MSNLLAQDTPTTTQQVWLLVGSLAVASIVGFFLGIHRPRSVLGPVRIRSHQPAWPLAVSLGIGAVLWFGTQFVYGMFRAAPLATTQPGAHFSIEQFTGEDYAFLATVPCFVAFAAMIFISAVMSATRALSGESLLQQIGFVLNKLPIGILKGLVGFVIVGPLMFGGAALLEGVYRLVGFKHPEAHELLSALKGSSPLVKWILIVGATLFAPVFEEFLFRGHLQTLLVRLLAGPKLKLPASAAAPAFALAPEGAVSALPIDYSAPQTAPAMESEQSRTGVWLAIVITSFVFAIVHPPWMAPLIFLLSLCLGYAYQRTGNLWTSITIHALFNTLNTIEFLWLFG